MFIHTQICKALIDRYLPEYLRQTWDSKKHKDILCDVISPIHSLWPSSFKLQARLVSHGTNPLVTLFLLSLPYAFIHLLLYLLPLLFLLSIFPLCLLLMFLLLALLLNLTLSHLPPYLLAFPFLYLIQWRCFWFRDIHIQIKDCSQQQYYTKKLCNSFQCHKIDSLNILKSCTLFGQFPTKVVHFWELISHYIN